MSHTIRAFYKNKKVAQIDFAAGDHITSNYIYKILSAENYNNGVSGNGISKTYEIGDIIKAKSALEYYAKEPYDLVRNKGNEEQSDSFMNSVTKALFGALPISGMKVIKDDVEYELTQEQERAQSIEEIKAFLNVILSNAQSDITIDFS